MVVWPPHSASPSPAPVWTRTQVLSRSCRVDPGAWLLVEPQKGKRVRPASSSPASGRQEGGTRGSLGFCLQRGPRVPRGGSWGRAGVGQGPPSGQAGTRGAGVRGFHRQVLSQLMFPLGLRYGAGGSLPRGVSRQQGRGHLETHAAALQRLTRLSP